MMEGSTKAYSFLKTSFAKWAFFLMLSAISLLLGGSFAYQYYFGAEEVATRHTNQADFSEVVREGKVFIPPLEDNLEELIGEDSDFPFEIDAGYSQAGPGILMPDGKTLRRYYPDFGDICGIVSQSSTDGGKTWVDDRGVRYSLEDEDCYMGVWTSFVTEEGGVVMLYNHNETWEKTGEELIYIRRIYSEPGDNGLDFELTDKDLIGLTHNDGASIKWADPNAVVLPDGRIRLIVMHQTRGEPAPPLGRTGALYSFISDDGGETFEPEGKIFGWDDFEEFEVYSLNDPKIIRLEDGRYRIFVAAMIPENDGFQWVILSAISEESD